MVIRVQGEIPLTLSFEVCDFASRIICIIPKVCHLFNIKVLAKAHRAGTHVNPAFLGQLPCALPTPCSTVG
jgi:hypothetical protein